MVAESVFATPEERTHLFEYSLVAALVHEALLERRENGRRVPAPAILALVISIALGWLDEGIQSLLPNRVYDNIDVLFNALAATIIISARSILAFVGRWVKSATGSHIGSWLGLLVYQAEIDYYPCP